MSGEYFYTDAFIRRDKVFVRGYANGKRFKEETGFEPFLFVPDSTGDFKTLEGNLLAKKTFPSIGEAKEFLKSYDGVSNFPIYGNPKFLYQYINQEFWGDIKYNAADVKVAYFDIEVFCEFGFPDPEKAEQEVSAITYILGDTTFVFGTKPYKPKSPNIHFTLCKNERDLLEKFLMLWTSDEWSPDVISGWSIEGFDVPYLVNRIAKVLGDKASKSLSPWNIIDEKEVPISIGRTRIEYTLRGIQTLDYINLYKKFTFINHESYALNHISHVELGEKKTDWSEYQSLTELYNKDYEMFIDYNINDTVLVKKLDEKLGFINQILFFAYDAKINYIDTLATVNVWDVIITNYLLDQKIAVPQHKPSTAEFSIVGGHVKEPKLGLSKWIVSFDFTSLYPHIVMGWNISNETFFDKVWVEPISKVLENGKFDPDSKALALAHNTTITAMGCLYKRDQQGFFPALMEKMFKDRVEARRKLAIAKKENQTNPTKELANEISRLNNLQQARKIQINAGYGAMANKYFRFFNSDIAESVTSTGQLAIQFTEKKINEFLNKSLGTKNVDYVIASDTDSLYITLEQMGIAIENIKNELSKKIQNKFS